MTFRATKLMAALGLAVTMGMVAVDTADAQRRGGGFGSRGMRTYRAPPPTRTAPQPAQPVQRTMTPPPAGQATPGAAPGTTAARPAAPNAAAATAPAQRRGGFLGGFGGGLLGGLLAGGLIGALLGNGFGAGMAGFGAMLLQLALIGGAVFLLMKLFRRRQQPMAAAAGGGWSPNGQVRDNPLRDNHARDAAPSGGQGFQAQSQGVGAAAPFQTYTPVTPTAVETPHEEEIGVTGADRDAFERLLVEIQQAFGREDYAALRERTTPEVMGFLAEDLASTATAGRRVELADVRLISADIAEAWREGDRDYATAAMRFSMIDVIRDRATGAVVEGDPVTPTELTEVWTFLRQGGADWKLSAIQEV